MISEKCLKEVKKKAKKREKRERMKKNIYIILKGMKLHIHSFGKQHKPGKDKGLIAANKFHIYYSHFCIFLSLSPSSFSNFFPQIRYPKLFSLIIKENFKENICKW